MVDPGDADIDGGSGRGYSQHSFLSYIYSYFIIYFRADDVMAVVKMNEQLNRALPGSSED